MLASSLFAASADTEGKVYISKDAIELTDEGMYVNWENQYVAVDSVHCDEEGYYLYTGEMAPKQGYMQLRWCRECKKHWPVGMFTSTCPRGHKF